MFTTSDNKQNLEKPGWNFLWAIEQFLTKSESQKPESKKLSFIKYIKLLKKIFSNKMAVKFKMIIKTILFLSGFWR